MCSALILVIILIIVFVILFQGKCSSDLDKYSTIPIYSNDLMTVGHPRNPGDYMVYSGEAPTGEGGYELESAEGNGGGVTYLEASLCQECTNNCVGLAFAYGERGNKLMEARRMCKSKCDLECNFSSGF